MTRCLACGAVWEDPTPCPSCPGPAPRPPTDPAEDERVVEAFLARTARPEGKRKLTRKAGNGC